MGVADHILRPAWTGAPVTAVTSGKIKNINGKDFTGLSGMFILASAFGTRCIKR